MTQSDKIDTNDELPTDIKKSWLYGAYAVLAIAAVITGFFLLERQSSQPPVKDIVWQPPASLPKNWKQAKTEKGVYQYLYEGSTCIVAMEHQSDVKTAGITSNVAIVERSAKTLAGTLKESSKTLKLTSPEKITFKTTGTDDKGKSGGTVNFEASNVVYETSGRVARIAAYIKGDHALVAGAVCGTKDFNERYAKEVSPFINTFTVTLKR